MAQYRGSARGPGPLGKYPGSLGGRLPGPLGNTLWDKQATPGDQSPAVKTAKKTIMPLPTHDQDGKDVHVVTWPLFNSSKQAPALDDIMQAPGIANCPVASILAAMAFTRTLPKDMVTETDTATLTDLSELPKGTLANPPTDVTISSDRFFTVKLPSGAVDVSDVLYTDDHDRGWSPLYLRDPNGESIWASIIEKALAVQLKSYENFDALDISANAFWKMITGLDPGVITIKDDTPLSVIITAAKDATRVPSIGASKPDHKDVKFVSEFHGFAMMGMEGSKIKIYDAVPPKTILLAPAEFKHDFQYILYRR